MFTNEHCVIGLHHHTSQSFCLGVHVRSFILYICIRTGSDWRNKILLPEQTVCFTHLWTPLWPPVAHPVSKGIPQVTDKNLMEKSWLIHQLTLGNPTLQASGKENVRLHWDKDQETKTEGKCCRASWMGPGSR